VRDTLVYLGALAAFPAVALLAPADPSGPIDRARALVGLEERLGLFVEPAIHGWVAPHGTVMAALGFFYVFAHLPALGGALVWTALERPAVYARLRAVALTAHAMTVLGYLLVPTAPPRLLGDPRFADTLGGLWGRGGSSLAHSVQSPYAAMPSGHVVFATLAGVTVALLARPLAVRVLAAAYPLLVAAVTVLTANHFWLDAVAGWTVCAVAAGAVCLGPRLGTHLADLVQGGRHAAQEG
jgi:hypothetical protein